MADKKPRKYEPDDPQEQKLHEEELRESSRRERNQFVAVYSRTFNTKKAAGAIGRTVEEVEQLRDDDDLFRQAWDRAMAGIVGRLREAALKRAISGWKEEVYHQGILSGYKQRYDNALLKFVLEKVDPMFAPDAEADESVEDFARRYARFMSEARATTEVEDTA